MDVLGWAAVAGGVALLGFAVVSGAQALPWIGGGKSRGSEGSGDGSWPWSGIDNADKVPDTTRAAIDSATQKVAESSQAWDEYLNQNQAAISSSPAYARAVEVFGREYQDYQDALADYKGESWTNYNALVKEANEAIAARGQLQSAYAELLRTMAVQN